MLSVPTHERTAPLVLSPSQGGRGRPSLAEAVGRVAEALRAAEIEQPRFEATLLVGMAVGEPREWVLAHGDHPLTPVQQTELETLLGRRSAREPMAYLRGHQEFFGRTFVVNPSVLIPRPESELLVEAGIHACQRAADLGRRRPLVVDLGTGSGTIAISVGLECLSARVLGLDLSVDALAVACENARRLGASNVRFVQGDLLGPIRAPVDVLLGNLPYVPEARYPTIQPELRYEPRLALFGGPTGLELIERALEQAGGLLAPDGELALEINETQGEAALQLAGRYFPAARATVLRDHAGLDRLLRLRLA